MTESGNSQIVEKVGHLFADRGFNPITIQVRVFPSETIVVVELDEANVAEAINLSSSIESELPESCIIVVRKAPSLEIAAKRASVRSLNDSRVSRLIELLNERSRTSEHQPSVEYIKDAAENLRVVLTRRHHLIFGRRGVGKTALLLEAKRQIERTGDLHLWTNLQVLRGLDGRRAFMTVLQRLCELPALSAWTRTKPPASIPLAKSIAESVNSLLTSTNVSSHQVAALVPRAQQLVALFSAERAINLYLFIDDLHYLEMREQALFLDLLHGITRDNPAWLKVAGIRNQCRVFTDNPPTGLQIGHDAAEISLDITLEEPRKARDFLNSVIETYLRAASIANRARFLPNTAVDRLVLASGGVPRDFLVLGARSIQIARLRPNARLVGVQDVNEAAGEAGKQKLAELEEDAAASSGQSARHLSALAQVREFTIETNHCSFFRVDIRDKNSHSEEYRLLQSLMDLRMIHLIKNSLSDAHIAGERSEVYMIDLSEFSGSRLKKNLNVIELRGDALVLRTTGKDGRTIVADSPRKVVQILRTGPLFALDQLSGWG